MVQQSTAAAPRVPADDHPDGQPPPSRYIVGIDLGTTNSALAYVDTAREPWTVQVFLVPQLVDMGQVESRETLPSFHYQPTAAELDATGLRLPWQRRGLDHLVGLLAREQGARSPGRLVASAKSWLCHSGVDRTAELLPWQALADVQRVSPLEASARYLRHFRDAWNHRFSKEPLEQQDIVLTLPASFDEVARELTVQAAAAAGLPRVVLIEEPQAAFYAWIDEHQADWDQRVQPGQKILVCDIGGGTSDFTLIRVRRGQDERVQFHRVAVGDHLILGGDNLDLALARHLEQGLETPLEPHQWAVLVRICRRVKEDILSDGCPETIHFNLPGSGARLIGGGLRVSANRDEARRVLLDGFFPCVGLDQRPDRRQSGFREFGLPYAADPAITRYLAAFLVAHRLAGEPDERENRAAIGESDSGGSRAGQADPARPDVLLFNGGVFASPLIRQRLIEVLASWFRGSDADWSPQVLDNARLDLAVAHGAAYYGAVRRGRGVRIAAGLARSYYIGIESQPPQAVCLVPGSAETGQTIDLDEHPFQLLVHQPVEFPLYVSSVRLADRPGNVLTVDEEQMKPLPPIRTVLRTRGKKQAVSIPVALHARLTEIGTLDLWCSEVGSQRSWRLQFDIRSATQTDMTAQATEGEAEGVIDEAAWLAARRLIEATFGAGENKPAGLVKQLAAALEMERWDWPMSLLRRIWETLMEFQAGRQKSRGHEQRWLNLLGFALRPGFGMAVDDWRVAETWRTVQGRLLHGSAATRAESWILWRRISGGLSAGQQQAIADTLLPPVRGLYRRLVEGKSGGEFSFTPQESIEMWRLLGSLELLDVPLKTELGEMLVPLLGKRSLQPARPAMVWALGRIGTRVPVYGPLNRVVPADVAARWLKEVMRVREAEDAERLAVLQLARRTGDRHRDLADKLRREVLDWLEGQSAPGHYRQLVAEGGDLGVDEQERVVGEAMPKGLRIP